MFQVCAGWPQHARGPSGSAADRRGPARPQLRPGLDPGRPEIVVIDVLQGDRHHLGHAVDGDMAKELQAKAGCEVLTLFLAAALVIDSAWSEGVVELLRRPGAGMQRAGD